MSDETRIALARRVLEGQDPHQLARLVEETVRESLASALVAAEPRAKRAPDRPEDPSHRAPAPTGYRHSETGWAPRQGTLLRGVTALDNEPLYDRIEVDANVPGEFLFFVTPLGWPRSLYRSGSQTKRRSDTNMVVAGRLPEPESFEVRGVSLVVHDDAPADFVTWLRHETYFELRFGGGQSLAHRAPTWELVRRTKTAAVLEDDLYVRPPVWSFTPDATVLIDRMENFGAALIAPKAWKRDGPAHETVRVILHGVHGKGVRRA